MTDIIITQNDLNNLFTDFRMMDVKIRNHRKGINRLSDDDFQKLLTKKWHMRSVMLTLHLMDTYLDWCTQMGI